MAKPEDIKKKARETAEIVEDALRSISSQVGQIFEEALTSTSNFSKTLKNDVTKGLNSLAKTSTLIETNLSKLNKGNLTRLDIEKQLEQRQIKLNSLQTQLNIAVKAKLVNEKEADKLLKSAVEYEKELTEELNQQADKADEINKKLGNTGKILKGFTKIPILGQLIDSEKVLAKVQAESAKEGATKTSVFKAGLKETGKTMKDSLLDPTTLMAGGFGILVKLVKMFVEAMFEADEQITNLGKSLNISKDAAREVRDRFDEISKSIRVYANTEANQLVLRKELIEAQLQLNSLLGNSIDYSKQLGESGVKLVAQFAAITKFLKLSGEEQQGLVNLSAITGKELNDIEYSILGTIKLYKIQNKYQVDEAKIFKDILKTSNYIKLSIKGGTDALIQATINASKLGVTLDQLSNTQSSLLNFEESISAELEAELLTGRDLNLERARYAALTNDQVALTEEINRLVADGSIDFEHNFLAAESMAKVLGISTKELADMVTAQKTALKLSQAQYDLSEEDIKLFKDKAKLTDTQMKLLSAGKLSGVEFYDALKKSGIGLENLAAQLGETEVKNLSAQSAQEKFNDSLEKAKEVFTSFIDGGSLDKFADFLTKFINSVAIQGLGKTLAFGLASDTDIDRAKLAEKEKNILTETDDAKKQQLQSEIDQLKAKLEIVGKAQVANSDIETQKAYAAVSKGEIMYAGSGPKFADGGIVTRRIDNASVGEAGPEAIIPLSQLMGHFNKTNLILEQILHKEGYVDINSSKFGTGYSLGTFKVQ
jgi:hypothetical protein